MVDTIRTRAALLTLLADNTSGNISPQDIRDTLVSLFGVFGGLSLRSGSTPQSGVTTTPTAMTGFAANLPAIGTTPAHASDNITLPTQGYYLLYLNVSFSGDNNTTWEFEIAEDAVGTGIAFERKIGVGGDVGDASCFGIIQTVADDQIISVLVNSDQAGGAEFTPTNAQLMAIKIA
jgi:hypothetical protein